MSGPLANAVFIRSFSPQVLPYSFVTPWTVAHLAPLSMGFPRQEHWSGLPFSSPGDLSDPGIEPVSPALAGGFFIAEPPGKTLACVCTYMYIYMYAMDDHSAIKIMKFCRLQQHAWI